MVTSNKHQIKEYSFKVEFYNVVHEVEMITCESLKTANLVAQSIKAEPTNSSVCVVYTEKWSV